MDIIIYCHPCNKKRTPDLWQFVRNRPMTKLLGFVLFCTVLFCIACTFLFMFVFPMASFFASYCVEVTSQGFMKSNNHVDAQRLLEHPGINMISAYVSDIPQGLG